MRLINQYWSLVKITSQPNKLFLVIFTTKITYNYEKENKDKNSAWAYIQGDFFKHAYSSPYL